MAISDNDDPADDKVYFFFTERVPNTDGGHKAVYSRVARVCAVSIKNQMMVELKTCKIKSIYLFLFLIQFYFLSIKKMQADSSNV